MLESKGFDMQGDNKLTIFACGNGDSIMIEALNKTILTDINYRTEQAEDEDNNQVPDFAPDIREKKAKKGKKGSKKGVGDK